MFKQLDLFASLQEPETPTIKLPQEKKAASVVAEEKLPVEKKQLLSQNIPVPEVETALMNIEVKKTTPVIADEKILFPGNDTFVEKEQNAQESEEIIIVEKAIIARAQKKQEVKNKPGKRGRKSLKEMSEEFEMIAIPEDEILFKKQYYSIGEVSSMFQLNTSLLRYWETEFDILKPRKNRKGDRHFRPEDIKNLYLIHHLLRQRKYTIEGAKDYLKKNKSKAQQNFELIQRLEKLKGFLLELKAGL